MKQYPSFQDYNLVVENLATFSHLDLLRRMVPSRGAQNRLIAYSGGYSRVYRVQHDGRPFALRCWTAEVPEVRERYRRISHYLRSHRPRSFVEFAYYEDALAVRGNPYPVLLMDWVEGETLRRFVGRHIGDGAMLEALAQEFVAMVRELHRLGISHGDLQDENILVEAGAGGEPTLRLIDYDSMFVPGLEGFSAPIAGIPAYQHPQRVRLTKSCPEVDYFSELVIFLSLLILAAYPDVWVPDGEKFLVFEEQDFLNPAGSALFARFRAEPGGIGRLTRELERFSREPDAGALLTLEQVLQPVTIDVPSTFLDTPAPPPHRARVVVLDDFSDWLSDLGRPTPYRSVPIEPFPDEFIENHPPRLRPQTPVELPPNFLT